MRKLRISEELKERIVKFKKKISELEPYQYDAKSGELNIEVYNKIQFYNSEIHLTNKKLNYLKQGKSYLGDSLSSYDTNGYKK